MTDAKTPTDTPARPGVAATLVMLLLAIPFVGILLLLYHALGIAAAFIGFLFLTYWTAIMGASAPSWLPATLGGLVGIGIGWLMIGGPVYYGIPALVAGVILLFAAVFCLIRGQLPLIANHSTVLFLTVAAIPQVELADNLLDMVAALIVAALYTGLILLGPAWVSAQRKRGRDEADTRPVG